RPARVPLRAPADGGEAARRGPLRPPHPRCRGDPRQAGDQRLGLRGAARRVLRPVTIPRTAPFQERPIMPTWNPGGGTAPLHFEDLRIGQRFVSGTHRLDEGQIRAFAEQFDPQPFHLDAEAAKGTLFGGLVASGWHTAAITMRLLVESGLPLAGGLIG